VEHFLGYPRQQGAAGIRNLVVVMSTSELLNRCCELVGEAVPGATSIQHFNASEQGSTDFHRRVLAGYLSNPNVAAVLLLATGDAGDDGDDLAHLVAARGVPVEVHTLRDAGGVGALTSRVIECARRCVDDAAAAQRQPVPIAQLLVGTECGGSDALSGLTANPALGCAVDVLIASGGTALLCELPELIGAEHLLARRAVDGETAQAVIDAVRRWEELVGRLGVDLRGAQPTPGNQAGGLTTVEEKSLGGVAKGGHNPVVEVVGYGVAPRRAGLVVMDTPGHDVEQMTGMAAAGAQLVVFTTGRGTPTAAAVAPTIKVSTNTAMASRLAEHIDVDAGGIATGRADAAQVGAQIWAEMLAVASGKPTKAERFGQADFAMPRTAPSWSAER
jgi:altronate dehydratase large subunit